MPSQSVVSLLASCPFPRPCLIDSMGPSALRLNRGPSKSSLTLFQPGAWVLGMRNLRHERKFRNKPSCCKQELPPSLIFHPLLHFLRCPGPSISLYQNPKTCSRSQGPSPLYSTFIHAGINNSYHLIKLAMGHAWH